MVEFIKLDKDKDDSKKRKPRRRGLEFSIKNIVVLTIIFVILSSLISGISYSMTPKIAVVPVKGAILLDESNSVYGGGGTSSRELRNILTSLQSDDSVKGVILDINSPGGSPVASEELSNVIEELKLTKPVYALITESGTSGALWVSVSANKTYVSEMSVVGSIGVTSATLSFEDFISEYNITYRKQTAGEYKDIGSIFREQTQKEEEIIQNLLDNIHQKFIQHVADSRGLSYDEVESIATGEIFLGEKAIENGLADNIGDLGTVVNDMRKITNESNAIIVDYSPQPTLAQTLGINTDFEFNQKSQILLK